MTRHKQKGRPKLTRDRYDKGTEALQQKRKALFKEGKLAEMPLTSSLLGLFYALKVIPKSPIERIDLLNRLSKDKKMKEYIKFYNLLKAIDKAPFKAREEYRKHVTLITPKIEVDVEKVKEFYEKAKEFVEFSSEFK